MHKCCTTFFPRALLKRLSLVLIAIAGLVNVNLVQAQLNSGNSGFPIWSPLTDFEKTTLAGVNKAKQGDGDALLALYLLSSGDIRSKSEYRKVKKVLDSWLASVEEVVEVESTAWRQGYRLHREMHKQFFLDGNLGENAGNGYDFEQSRLSEVFRSEKFNCVSASLLFTVLAQKSGFSTQGVLLPSHVFVELTLSDERVVEVETTSASGYDWVHDEEFYERSESQDWFDQRGLQPSSYTDYQNRQIITPFQLGVQNMKNQHVRPERMDYEDRMRLIELVSELSPDDIKSHKIRLGFYSREYARLRDLNDFASIDRMFNQVTPFLNRLVNHPGVTNEIENLLGWINSQRALAAINNNRGQFGVELAQLSLSELREDIEDFAKIKNNLYFALSRFVESKITNEQYVQARAVFTGIESDCVKEKSCIGTLRHLYSRWAGHYWASSDWPQVINRYLEFLLIESDGKAANLFKENLQSAYLNWSILYLKDSDWLGASEILNQCIQNSPSAGRCQARLDKLKSQHRLE